MRGEGGGGGGEDRSESEEGTRTGRRRRWRRGPPPTTQQVGGDDWCAPTRGVVVPQPPRPRPRSSIRAFSLQEPPAVAGPPGCAGVGGGPTAASGSSARQRSMFVARRRTTETNYSAAKFLVSSVSTTHGDERRILIISKTPPETADRRVAGLPHGTTDKKNLLRTPCKPCSSHRTGEPRQQPQADFVLCSSEGTRLTRSVIFVQARCSELAFLGSRAKGCAANAMSSFDQLCD